MDAFIIDAVRTPIGRYGGALSSVRPDDLSAIVIKALLARQPTVPPAAIEEVIWGAANQAGEDNRNVARMALLLAGLPVSVAGCTVNRLCASGLQAVMDAAKNVSLGLGELMIAGGVESMSRAPFVMAKSTTAFNRTPEIYDTTIGWRFTNPALADLYYPYGMGETAENVAEQWGISRTEQDSFAIRSQQKYAAAAAANKFANELVAVPITPRKAPAYQVTVDEHPRSVTAEKMAALQPAFKKGGTVTAGNSSGINDGAAALLIASELACQKYNLPKIARIVAMAVAGVEPATMGIGPVPAVRKVLQRSGLQVSDIGLWELNEAFAAQSIACIKELGIDEDIINVNGGAIALGHPLGCSGARIATSLVHEMQKNETATYGIATMCVGVGQGAALLVERL